MAELDELIQGVRSSSVHWSALSAAQAECVLPQPDTVRLTISSYRAVYLDTPGGLLGGAPASGEGKVGTPKAAAKAKANAKTQEVYEYHEFELSDYTGCGFIRTAEPGAPTVWLGDDKLTVGLHSHDGRLYYGGKSAAYLPSLGEYSSSEDARVIGLLYVRPPGCCSCSSATQAARRSPPALSAC